MKGKNAGGRMKIFRWIILLGLLLGACKGASPTATPVSNATPTSRLPTPFVQVTKVPSAEDAAKAFFEAWKVNNYDGMYDLISGASRDANTREDFIAYYNSIANNLTLQSLDIQILSSLTNPSSAQVGYRATYATALLGQISRDMVMNLSLEGGTWKVQWSSNLLMPELEGGNRLALDVKWPSRGNIYDRNGNVLAANSEAYALGVVPAEVGEGQMAEIIAQLSLLTARTGQSINADIQASDPQWYVPVGEAPRQSVDRRYEYLSTLSGLKMSLYSGRYYPDSLASQVVGYELSISPEQLDFYKRQGYAGDEKVGQEGLEYWGEEELAGKPGASLYVIRPDGSVSTRLVQVDAVPPKNIYTTLDADVQEVTQKSLLGFTGAAIVMERDTGRILAMASSPWIDSNLFTPDNVNNSALSRALQNPYQPLLNRATQGIYPPGSVFKVVVLAAALESEVFSTVSTYECGHDFTELPGQIFYDWTYYKQVPPSGNLTLPEALMRSCDPWFYHIGLELYRQKGAYFVSNIATGFGLGEETGIAVLPEEAGSIPVSQTEGDSIQQSIGQGAMLVTPLQVVDYMSAVGNGGTLFQPQIIEKITTADGIGTQVFKPVERGKLPVSPKNLGIIQDAMREVVKNQRGTAHKPFIGLEVAVYGKTGSAQHPGEDPHSWFAGYTNNNREDLPDIAVVVIAENVGEGSEIAAPIFRRIVEGYFQLSLSLYPWESTYYVTRTPTPETTAGPEETPAP